MNVFPLLVFGLLFGASRILETQAAHIKIQVYYETRCPDSRRFITTQLHPTIHKLGGVSNEFLEAELIPYGKATTEFTNGTFQFTCQNGDKECEGNKVHACALQMLPFAQSATFVNCSMTLFNSPTSDPECVQSLNLDWTRVDACLQSWEAGTLLAANGIKTQSLKPALYYLPWIVVNGVFNEDDLDLAQKDLFGLVCQKLGSSMTKPTECSGGSG